MQEEKNMLSKNQVSKSILGISEISHNQNYYF